jgi:hypothetical protein
MKIKKKEWRVMSRTCKNTETPLKDKSRAQNKENRSEVKVWETSLIKRNQKNS